MHDRVSPPEKPASWLRLLLGRKLANNEHEDVRIGWIEAVPAMGLDGLGSSSYGPEAALTVLIPLGALGLTYMGPVIGVIIVLLLILYLSYRQTVIAYPSNGGAYIVARTNLGELPSLLAAAALMIDYVLNVAVGVSAGVGALVSTLPQLHPYILPLCLGILVVVMLANLRGTGEAGWLFALPTYLFIVCFIGAIGFGLWTAANSSGAPHPVIAPPALAAPTAAASLWLLMHAFASGCTAMTGVEAVSNGVGSFREPVIRNAHRTLTIIVAVLAVLLGGIAILATRYHIGAMDQNDQHYQSVLSQLLAAVGGRNAFYYVAMSSLLCVLCLSANTSFVGFPRLCRMVATDGYLPRAFAQSGRRLVFTAGILFLSVFATLLLVIFGGITDRLIPLFAIGAFLTFTISQAGMVVHWRRQGGNMARLAINAIGGGATAIALVIILIAKFAEGAWITVIAVPVTILLLKGTRGYYDAVDRELRAEGPIAIDQMLPPTVLVIFQAWDKLSERALKFALTISSDVVAVHVSRLAGPEMEEDERRMRRQWCQDIEDPITESGLKPPRLIFLGAPYREMHTPLLRLIDKLDKEAPERTVAVLIPETIKEKWWHNLFHMHRARRLRQRLLRDGGPRLTVVSIPWRLAREDV